MGMCPSSVHTAEMTAHGCPNRIGVTHGGRVLGGLIGW
ncbi:hypothetical protein MPS_2677 [Mycobacterium pseudoshottsii JCM 15466]|nr:hypothetical protein MPS_2677 [Mycobacterium pseudoshottsii JCM 15466]